MTDSRHCATRYLADSVATASPGKLLVMLFDRLVAGPHPGRGGAARRRPAAGPRPSAARPGHRHRTARPASTSTPGTAPPAWPRSTPCIGAEQLVDGPTCRPGRRQRRRRARPLIEPLRDPGEEAHAWTHQRLRRNTRRDGRRRAESDDWPTSGRAGLATWTRARRAGARRRRVGGDASPTSTAAEIRRRRPGPRRPGSGALPLELRPRADADPDAGSSRRRRRSPAGPHHEPAAGATGCAAIETGTAVPARVRRPRHVTVDRAPRKTSPVRIGYYRVPETRRVSGFRAAPVLQPNALS